jgi:hypothetical protein
MFVFVSAAYMTGDLLISKTLSAHCRCVKWRSLQYEPIGITLVT